ncbi:LysR family transcriptional regulator [Enterovibrio calviensis]|uniref:LysR family transcriptional regulator n=1 Tax=Enterovibrio calviensis TaxID=91359 RepID=UPI00048285A1|nr:LysR family transcriptional regulator [Enterovibrio calviensis]
MNITYDQVEAFIAVADSGSFSAAAKQIGKHRTTLGQTIANLEIEIDLVLFDRSGRYPSLTSDGEKIYQQAKALAVASSAFEQLCLYQSKGVETELKIYYSEQLPAQIIVDTMIQLRQHYQQVRVHWLKDSNDNILKILSNREADLALVVNPMGDSVTSLDFTYLFQMPYTLCASKDFIRRHRPQGMASLQHLHQLVLKDYYHSGVAKTVCTSNQVQVFDSLPTLVSLLKSGEGWAMLPSHSVSDDIAAKHLDVIPIKELNNTLRFPVICWQASKSMGPVASFVIEQIKQRVNKYELM